MNVLVLSFSLICQTLDSKAFDNIFGDFSESRMHKCYVFYDIAINALEAKKQKATRAFDIYEISQISCKYRFYRSIVEDYRDSHAMSERDVSQLEKKLRSIVNNGISSIGTFEEPDFGDYNVCDDNMEMVVEQMRLYGIEPPC